MHKRPTHKHKNRPPSPAPARDIALNLQSVAPLEAPPHFFEAAKALGIEFEPGDVEKLGRYLAMLLAANQAMNLTSIRESDEAWIKHVLDSLTLLPVLSELPEGASVIDVGSGGGLPGLPLAIVCPTLKFTLLEATGKKVEFLRQAVAAMGLQNARVVPGRAESVAHDRGARAQGPRIGGHREAYDAVVARAVGALNVLAELTVPFARIGGVVALIKGQRADAEIAHAKEALHQLKAVHETTIDTPTGRVVVLSKGAATPRIYPRADGEPKRSPIGGKMPIAEGADEQ